MVHHSLQILSTGTGLVKGFCAEGVQVENGSGGQVQTDVTQCWVRGAAVPPYSL